MSLSDIPIRQPDSSTDPEPTRIFAGRTGIGREVVVDEVGAWLDIRYIDAEGEIAGFSVNPKYAAELAEALVRILVRRAQ